MQVKITITSHQSEWPSFKKTNKKKLQTVNAGEDVDKREPYGIVGRNINWCNHYGEQYGHSLINQE